MASINNRQVSFRDGDVRKFKDFCFWCQIISNSPCGLWHYVGLKIIVLACVGENADAIQLNHFNPQMLKRMSDILMVNIARHALHLSSFPYFWSHIILGFHYLSAIIMKNNRKYITLCIKPNIAHLFQETFLPSLISNSTCIANKYLY